MKKIIKISLILVSLACCSTVYSRDLDPSKYSSKLKRFLGDVAYEVEAGQRDKKLKRLPKYLTVRFHCNADEKLLCEKKLSQFLDATKVTLDKPEGASTRAASLDIFFGESRDMEKKAAEISKDITMRKGHTYWKWWDNDDVVNRAVVFICRDKISGEDLEDKLVEKFLGVFGLPGRSDSVENTCLGEKSAINANLLPLDTAVLKFLYQHVPAGTRPAELKKLVQKNWASK